MAGVSNDALKALLGPLVNRDDGTFPPLPHPVLLTDHATVYVPHPFYPGSVTELPLSRGTALAWAPFLDVDGALLVIGGGNPIQPTDEAIAVTLSRAGLDALIRDLKSIALQLELI